MKINKQFDINNGVHTIEILDDNNLAVIDVNNSFRLYDLQEFKLIDGFKSKFEPNVLYINNMAISRDGKHLSFYNKKSREVSIFDMEKKKFTHTINAHTGGVETVEFTLDDKYLITGGMEGRLYMWSVATGKKVDTLSHHNDSISAIASHENGRWIATAGYDRVIKVFNRSFRTNNYKLISHKEPITTVTFLSNQRLLSTDKDGVILVWDIVKASVVTRLAKFDSHITAVCVDKEEKFLFVAGLAGMVALYDLEEGKLLKIDFLKQLAGITQMKYCDENKMLIFGLSNGHIPIYLLESEEDAFIDLMENKKFDSCYKMVQENPLLLYSESYKSLEALFSGAYEHAKRLLREGKKWDAEQMLRHFSASSEKRLLVQKLFKDYAVFETFSNAVKTKKYMMAYSLAAEYGSLKNTPEYESMEVEWNKILNFIRKIINDKTSEEKIKLLFKPFMGIPGKNLIIKSLYSNRNVFILFIKHLKEKDYFNAFKLVKGHPFLEELEEFTKLVRIGELIKDNTTMTFNDGSYYDAVKQCDVLAYFPAQKEFADGLRAKANIYAETMQYFAEKQFGAVYNMIEAHPFLEEAKITADIEKGFLSYYEQAENYAASGNVAAVKKVMEKFSKIKSKLPSILHLVKVSYWAQIEQASDANVPDKILQDAFKKYQNIFGYESTLEDILKTINQRRNLKITFDTSMTDSYKGSLEMIDLKVIDY